MTKKHQIYSSNKKTRKKAGRKWRRQSKEYLKGTNKTQRSY